MEIMSEQSKSKYRKNFFKYGSLLVLVVQNVSSIVLVRYSRTRGSASSAYLGSAAVLATEMLKFSINLVLECIRHKRVRSFPELLTWVKNTLITNQTLRLGLPALLYVIQNNLLFVALANLSVPVYVVLNQGKLIATAICSRFLLQKRLSLLQWFSIMVLAIGVAIVQLSQIDDAGKHNSQQQSHLVGVTAIGISCITSSFAGVYFEKMLKTESSGKNTSLHVLNMQLSSWSILFSGLTAFVTDGAMIREHGLLQGFDGVIWVMVTNQALGGLLVAIVMKHADNILKGFATSISIIFSCLLALCLWDISLDLSFGLGTMLVIGAVFLYEGVCPSCKVISLKWCGFPTFSITRLVLSAIGFCVVLQLPFSTNRAQYLRYILKKEQLKLHEITFELSKGRMPQYHSCGVLALTPAFYKREFGPRMSLHDAMFWSNDQIPDLLYRDRNLKTKSSFQIMSQRTIPTIRFSVKSTVESSLRTDDSLCNLLLEYTLSLPDYSSDKIVEAFNILLSGLDLPHHSFNRNQKKSTCSPRMVAVVDAALTCAEVDLYGYAECDKSFPIGSSKSSEIQAAEKAMIDALLNLPSTKCAPMFLMNKCFDRTQLPLPDKAKDCAIVGSAGKLKGSNLGSVINSHDIVVRINLAPVKGHEMDVGNRTDIRLINHPSWTSVNKVEEWEKREFLMHIDPISFDSVQLISVFGPQPAIRYSPVFEQTCLNVFTEKQIKDHKIERHAIRFQPTLGFEALMRCMYICTRIHVFGMSNPAEEKDLPYHYYDHEEQRDYLQNVTWDAWAFHNFALEKGKVKEWVQSHIIDQD